MGCDDGQPQLRTERGECVVTTGGVRLNDEGKGKSMDQRAFWVVNANAAPKDLRRPLMASPEPGRMIAFASFHEFMWGMSVQECHLGNPD
jgi:hypothetical protein